MDRFEHDGKTYVIQQNHECAGCVFENTDGTCGLPDTFPLRACIGAGLIWVEEAQ